LPLRAVNLLIENKLGVIASGQAIKILKLSVLFAGLMFYPFTLFACIDDHEDRGFFESIIVGLYNMGIANIIGLLILTTLIIISGIVLYKKRNKKAG